MNVWLKFSSFLVSSLSALPVTQTRALLPARQSCVNAHALQHRRSRRVRIWLRRVRTTPLTNPPPRPSRLSREHTPCSQPEAVGRILRWAEKGSPSPFNCDVLLVHNEHLKCGFPSPEYKTYLDLSTTTLMFSALDRTLNIVACLCL